MDSPCLTKSCSPSATSSEDSSNVNNVIVKLRRLKIEENILAKSVNKFTTPYEAGTNFEINSENKNYLTDLKNSYSDIVNLFQEIRAATNSQDLKDLDLEDIKKDVLTLETKIKVMKTYTQSELTTLRNNERTLTQELNDPVRANKNEKKTKVHATPFKEIVPSPVKLLINSPLKCPEVQEFQTFMKVSKNSCGGWIPYNHNIFQQLWERYFKSNFYAVTENVTSCDKFPNFVDDLYKKIAGITIKEILDHCVWYSRYVYLKDRQQESLERWKKNKKIIKKNLRNDLTPSEKKRENVTGSKRGKSCEISNITQNESSDINATNTYEFQEMEIIISETINSKIFQVMTSNNVCVEDVDDIVKNSVGTSDIHLMPQKIETLNFKSGNDGGSGPSFLQPTIQSANRSKSKGLESSENLEFVDVEKITKLRIPEWRQVLKNNQLH